MQTKKFLLPINMIFATKLVIAAAIIVLLTGCVRDNANTNEVKNEAAPANLSNNTTENIRYRSANNNPRFNKHLEIIELPVQFETIAYGQFGPAGEKGNYVISTSEDWRQFLARTNMFDDPAPEIDFNSNMALVVFLGEKSDGLYDIQILEIYFNPDSETLKVEILECYHPTTTLITTSPYHIVKLRKITQDIEFIQSSQLCD